jgi:hypothetical protein
LADLQARRARIEALGTGLVLVHMLSDEIARTTFAKYGLDDLPRMSDPGKRLYAAFDLKRGTLSQLLGPRNWLRGFQAVVSNRMMIPVGLPQGADTLQMPGAFLVHDGAIVKAFRHESASDRPDYADLAACPLPPRS